MLDDIRGMIVFARVVENGSFAAAARKLNVSRAAISHSISQMEARLNVKLLHRSTRSLSLTDAGRTYYQSCALIAEEAFAANQKVREHDSEPSGRLSVTCSTNFGLNRIVPLLSEFRKNHPAVELTIDLSDEITNLIEEGFDLAIRAGPLSNSELLARKICTTDRLICASPDYLKRCGTPKTPDDLATHSWVAYSQQSRTVELNREGQKKRIRISGPVQTNSAGARLKLVLEGHGLGLLPGNEVKSEGSEKLIPVLTDYSLPQLDLYAVYPRNLNSPVKVRMLVDFLIKSFQKPAKSD